MTTPAGSPKRRLPERPDGLTDSEGRLERLCRETFLTLWSYPGVCKDQGTGGGRTGSKEVCDLLVVFENDIIIFSDKNCAYPSSGNAELDWSRWHDRAITRSAKQLRGAERWILEHPDRLFIDRECKYPFPYPLPKREDARIHRVVVAGGAASRCRAELGGSGSLMLTLGGPSDMQTSPPFTIGRADGESGFIHVFDEVTIRIVLGALDTISDFVAYLLAKEELAGSGVWVMAAGEEDLLAQYVKNIGPSGAHAFGFEKKFSGIVLEEGAWDQLQTNHQWVAKLQADRVSYAWDSLIETFNYYAVSGESAFEGYTDLHEFEKGIRFLAREPRLKRRILANALLGIMKNARIGQERATRIVMPFVAGDPYYVFLALQRPSSIPMAKYRLTRREMLVSLCRATRQRWPAALDVVGLATEPTTSVERSEDLVYLDGREWTDAQDEETTAAREHYGLFNSLRLHPFHTEEYPAPPAGRRRPVQNRGLQIGRNSRCPCGSGRKFKRCCGSVSLPVKDTADK